jgi:hypothetical protein
LPRPGIRKHFLFGGHGSSSGLKNKEGTREMNDGSLFVMYI